MSSLSKLKAEIKERYKSTFDFETFEIDNDTKNEVIKREANIFKNFEKYSQSSYEICKSLYEVSILLKGEGSFMAWYQNIGLTKDKVSELLKRWQLYINMPDKIPYIASLSNQAVKIITNKNIDETTVLKLADKGIKKVEDIKKMISPSSSVLPKETNENKNNIEKSITSSNDLNELKKLIKNKELELKNLKSLLAQKEKEIENKDNLLLFKPSLATVELLFLRENNIHIDLDDYDLISDFNIELIFDEIKENTEQVIKLILRENNIEKRNQHYKALLEEKNGTINCK